MANVMTAPRQIVLFVNGMRTRVFPVVTGK
jgi:hypothetical protein